MSKIRVEAVPRRWGCRRWSRASAVPWRPATIGVTLMLGRVEVAAWRDGFFTRDWWRRPHVWNGRGAGFVQVVWWRFTLHLEIDPISVSMR